MEGPAAIPLVPKVGPRKRTMRRAEGRNALRVPEGMDLRSDGPRDALRTAGQPARAQRRRC